jgi:hypothetical protein
MAETQVNPEQEGAVLLDQIYYSELFNKLAATYGYRPRDEDEAARVLQLVPGLEELQRREMAKQASTRQDFLAYASGQLNEILYGPGAPAVDAQTEAYVKAAAADYAKNPAVQAAVLQVAAALDEAARETQAA